MTVTSLQPSMSLWMTVEENPRFYVIDEDQELPNGDVEIKTPEGKRRKVAAEVLQRFEVSEAEAIRWAKQELGDSLDELKHVIDDKLADWQQKLDEFKNTPVKSGSQVTPETATAFFDFLKQLPTVFRDSVSGDESRVDDARKTAADLQQRLNDAGLTADERLKNFPDRLAKIKKQSKRKPQQKSNPL